MGTYNLQAYLQDRLDDRFRGMVKYDSAGMEIEYLRDDVEQQRLQSQFNRMIHRLKPEASAAAQNSFPLGDLHATLQYFDEAIVLHLPTSQRGESLCPWSRISAGSSIVSSIRVCRSYSRFGGEKKEVMNE